MTEEIYDEAPVKHSMKVYGHSGGFAPLDSIESFQKAISYELDGVDMDVWLTSDHQLVIISAGYDGNIYGSGQT
jgi:glycerophosphoryl diester phosphodiesterase